MGEQFKDLKFDMDEEIEARNEREGRRVHTAYRAAPPMSVSHAIVLAAIIIVVGLWGGKLAYDYGQAKQMEAALIYAAQSFKAATQGSERQFQQQVREAQRQAASRAAQLEQQSQSHAGRTSVERTMILPSNRSAVSGGISSATTPTLKMKPSECSAAADK